MIAATLYSFTVLAENPEGLPRIITDQNASASGNMTTGFATNQLFGYSNFTGVIM